MKTRRWNLNCSIEELACREVRRKYLDSDYEWLKKISSWEFQLFKKKCRELFEMHDNFSESLHWDNWFEDDIKKIETNYQICLERRARSKQLDIDIQNKIDEIAEVLTNG